MARKNNHVGNMNAKALHPKGTVEDVGRKATMPKVFYEAECYPGNNDSRMLGMRNKSPQIYISGNLNLSKMPKRYGPIRIEGEFGEVITHANMGSSYQDENGNQR